MEIHVTTALDNYTHSNPWLKFHYFSVSATVLYFDQSDIPLLGMQGSSHGEIDGQDDENIQF